MANSDNCFRLDQAIRKQVPLPLARGQVRPRFSRTLFTVAMALLQCGELVQQLQAAHYRKWRCSSVRHAFFLVEVIRHPSLVRSNANGWSVGMQTSGQQQCKRVVKWSAISHLGTFHRRIQVALKNSNACFDAAITFTEAHKCVIYRT